MGKINFDWPHILEQPLSDPELAEWSDRIAASGYSALRLMIGHVSERVESFTDGEREAMGELLRRCRRLVPHPGRISPAWETVWDRMQRTVEAKASVLEAIPRHERDGEWQIVMDNPYTNQEVVCYPALSFERAAYLYGYFMPGLKQNEYIRLQKVQTVIMRYGSRENPAALD